MHNGENKGCPALKNEIKTTKECKRCPGTAQWLNCLHIDDGSNGSLARISRRNARQKHLSALLGDEMLALLGDKMFALLSDEMLALLGDKMFALIGDKTFALIGDKNFARLGDEMLAPHRDSARFNHDITTIASSQKIVAPSQHRQIRRSIASSPNSSLHRDIAKFVAPLRQSRHHEIGRPIAPSRNRHYIATSRNSSHYRDIAKLVALPRHSHSKRRNDS
jgi:hypothetical protein